MDVYDVLDTENKVSVAADLMMTPDSLSTCVCGKAERGIEWLKGEDGRRRSSPEKLPFRWNGDRPTGMRDGRSKHDWI